MNESWEGEEGGHLGTRLHDWLDGELDAAASEAVVRHLEACPRCRREAADVRALRQRAAALPPDVPPARDLWPEIAARLGEQEPSALPSPAARAPRRGVHPAWAWSGWLAAAAVLALLLLRPLPRPPAPGTDGMAGGAGSESASAAVVADLEAGSQSAQADYLAALREHARDLAPETRAVIERNLKVIDRAIVETRAALATDPRNPELARRLATGYRERIALLRQATRLPARI